MERIIKRQRAPGPLESFLSEAVSGPDDRPPRETTTERPGRPVRPTSSEEEEEETTTRPVRGTTINSVPSAVIASPTTAVSVRTSTTRTTSSTAAVGSSTAQRSTARSVSSTSSAQTNAQSNAPAQANAETKSSSKTGAIAGVVGAIAGLLLLFGIFVVWRKRRSAAKFEAEQENALQRAGMRSISPAVDDFPADNQDMQQVQASHPNFAPVMPQPYPLVENHAWGTNPAATTYPTSPSYGYSTPANNSEVSFNSTSHLPVSPIIYSPHVGQSFAGQQISANLTARKPLIFDSSVQNTTSPFYPEENMDHNAEDQHYHSSPQHFDSTDPSSLSLSKIDSPVDSMQEVIGPQPTTPVLSRQDSSVARPMSSISHGSTSMEINEFTQDATAAAETRRKSVRASQVPLPPSPNPRLSRAPQLDYHAKPDGDDMNFLNVMFAPEDRK